MWQLINAAASQGQRVSSVVCQLLVKLKFALPPSNNPVYTVLSVVETLNYVSAAFIMAYVWFPLCWQFCRASTALKYQWIYRQTKLRLMWSTRIQGICYFCNKTTLLKGSIELWEWRRQQSASAYKFCADTDQVENTAVHSIQKLSVIFSKKLSLHMKM